MTYQDILIAAIKKEKRAAELYRQLLGDATDSEARAVFEQLVTEELNHKNHFESLYERDIMKEN